MKTIFFFICISFSATLTAQFLNQEDSIWRVYKKQIYFGFGGTQFLGDLGGSDGPGKTFGMGDMNLRATSWNLNYGFRYQFHPLFATSTNLYFGKYRASDFYTSNYKRAQRKIDIKSTIIELSQRFEFIFYSKYKQKSKNEKSKTKRFEAFAFTGLGFTYFNPQGGPHTKYEGLYLRPLSTEGQGFPGGTKEYNQYTLSIPFGFGIQKSFSRRRSIRFEVSYMKTFTDYMDDTSGKYYNYVANNIVTSPETIYFSNPAEGDGYWQKFKNGDPRGGEGNDCYFFANFVFVKAMGMKSKRMKRVKEI
jgi:hypothetical protein